VLQEAGCNTLGLAPARRRPAHTAKVADGPLLEGAQPIGGVGGGESAAACCCTRHTRLRRLDSALDLLAAVCAGRSLQVMLRGCNSVLHLPVLDWDGRGRWNMSSWAHWVLTSRQGSSIT
jgi:hypothetical protein